MEAKERLAAHRRELSEASATLAAERKRHRAELDRYLREVVGARQEIEAQLDRLSDLRIEFRERLENLSKDRHLEQLKEKFIKDAARMVREAEDKLSELGVTRDILQDHLRGLGVA